MEFSKKEPICSRMVRSTGGNGQKPEGMDLQSNGTVREDFMRDNTKIIVKMVPEVTLTVTEEYNKVSGTKGRLLFDEDEALYSTEI